MERLPEALAFETSLGKVKESTISTKYSEVNFFLVRPEVLSRALTPMGVSASSHG